MRKISLLLSIVMTASLLTGCSDKNNGNAEGNQNNTLPEDKVIEISLGGQGIGVLDADLGKIPQIDYIEEKFGIKLNVVPDMMQVEKINAAIAGGDIPDLFLVTTKELSSLLPGKMVQPLDEYITPETAPNMYKYAEEALVFSKEYYSDDSNSLYTIPSHMSTGAPAFLINPFMRWDYYQEIGCPVINNFDDLLDAMLEVKKLHPTNENGEEYYGMGMSFASRLWSYCVPFGFMLEGRHYRGDYFLDYDIVSDTYTGLISDENSSLWNGVRVLNKMQRNGLLDPEVFTINDATLLDRTAQDRYLVVDLTWTTGGADTNFQSAGINTQFLPMVTGPEAAFAGTYSEPVGSVGYMWTISSGVPKEYIPRIVEFLDWCFTPDGSRTLIAGLEGEAWEKKDDGTAKFTEQFIKDRTTATLLEGYGGGKLSGLAGLASQYYVEETGQYIDIGMDPDFINEGYTPLQKEWCKKFGYETMLDPIADSRGYIHKSIAVNLLPALTTDQSRTYSIIENYLVTSLPKLVLEAETDEELEQGRKQMLEELKGLGYEEYEKFWLEEITKAQAQEKEILDK